VIQAIYIEMAFFVQSPLESWHLLKADRVVEVFQDVLDKFSDVGKKDKLLKFFKLVQDFFNKLGVLIDGDFKLVYCYLC
jgi:hypothetical protein